MTININNLSKQAQVQQNLYTQVKQQIGQSASTDTQAKQVSHDSVSLTPQAKQLTELHKKAKDAPCV